MIDFASPAIEKLLYFYEMLPSDKQFQVKTSKLIDVFQKFCQYVFL